MKSTTKKINPTKSTSSTFKRLQLVMSDLIDAVRDIFGEGSQAAIVSRATPLPHSPCWTIKQDQEQDVLVSEH